MYSNYKQFERISRNQDQFVQLPPKNLKKNTNTKDYYVVIDSTDRDRTVESSSSSFTVKMDPENTYNGATLPRKYKNVKCVELISASYPTLNNSADEMYLVLNIEELSGRQVEKTSGVNGFLLTPRLVLTNFIHHYSNESNPSRIVFDTYGKSLEKFTIKILKRDGTIFSFGTDTTPPTAPNPLLQFSCKLKITTIEPDIFS